MEKETIFFEELGLPMTLNYLRMQEGGVYPLYKKRQRKHTLSLVFYQLFYKHLPIPGIFYIL